MKIAFQIFVHFFLFLGVTSAPTVYSELESVTKLIFSFVPRSYTSVFIAYPIKFVYDKGGE